MSDTHRDLETYWAIEYANDEGKTELSIGRWSTEREANAELHNAVAPAGFHPVKVVPVDSGRRHRGTPESVPWTHKNPFTKL